MLPAVPELSAQDPVILKRLRPEVHKDVEFFRCLHPKLIEIGEVDLRHKVIDLNISRQNLPGRNNPRRFLRLLGVVQPCPGQQSMRSEKRSLRIPGCGRLASDRSHSRLLHELPGIELEDRCDLSVTNQLDPAMVNTLLRAATSIIPRDPVQAFVTALLEKPRNKICVVMANESHAGAVVLCKLDEFLAFNNSASIAANSPLLTIASPYAATFRCRR